MKKLISMVMVMIIAVSYTVFFVNAEDLKFTDVPTDAWYYSDVKNAVGLGLINGKSETTYCPDDNLTYAEAIKLAACMYDVYKNGTVTIVPGGAPWYQVYVDYAKSHGIIEMNYNYNDFATRAGYMEIFARALPNEALKEINYVPNDSIPDVKMLAGYAEDAP